MRAGETDLRPIAAASTARGRASGIALAVATLVASLGAAEIVLRAILPPTVRATLPGVGLSREEQNRLEWLERVRENEHRYGFDEPDPQLGWRVRPNVRMRSVKPGSYDAMVSTTPDGLRGGTTSGPGRPRIAIFGCSQTFGEGVDDADTYAARLARALPQAEVLNFGVHGYGTDQMLLRYERDGSPRKPDVVALAFAGFHVARNVSRFTYFAKPAFELGPDNALHLEGVPVPSPEEIEAAPRDAIVDHGLLLRWVWQRVRNVEERRLYQTNGHAWRLTRTIISRFASEAERDHAIFILMNIDENTPQLDNAIRALSAELDVGFLDLAPVMRRARDAGIPYRLANDNHWSPTGHKIVAAELRAYLCRQWALGLCKD
jgi:hypothetical protein